MSVHRFSLYFTAFVGSASALALVLVAGISFACQSARAAMGGDKGSEMRFTPASRPQDGLSQAVNTPRPTGGKPVDLRRATREVAAGSPGFEDCSPRVENTPEVSRYGQSGLATVGSLQGESGLSLPGALRSDLSREPWPSEQGVPFFAFDPRTETVQPETEGLLVLASPGSGVHALDRTQGVRSVPGRAVPNEVVLLRDARGHLRSLATSAAHLCGVPVRLFHSLIARESSWNPRARSSSGALGLGQLMPAAAKEMGVEDRLDPWQNALGAACFLRKQYDRAGSWRKALLSYHGGPNRVRTSQASHDYAQDIIEGSAN